MSSADQISRMLVSINLENPDIPPRIKEIAIELIELTNQMHAQAKTEMNG